uniref:Reverse transcriptase zinc-binding domain-containing protein n=1 Tax=Cannabis sativa TaxID=3483 RepID=A0A803QKE8_CANSA
MLRGLKLLSLTPQMHPNAAKTSVYCHGMSELEVDRVLNVSGYARSYLSFRPALPRLIAWDNIYLPESAGGLGFRRRLDWNLAAMGKWYWKRIVSVNDIFKAKVSFGVFLSQNYTIKTGVELMAPQEVEISWRKFDWEWDRLITPKHWFIMWIFMGERLNTKDQVAKYNPNMSTLWRWI